jgi:chromate transporter
VAERNSDPAARRTRLREVAVLFLRLGLTAFGGPAAHVALMESEVVRKRHWLSAERFLDMLSAANLIPGPSSSELAVFIGYEQAGALGLVTAGVCFLLPAALLATAFAWLYVRLGSLPRFGGLLYGIKPVVIAIVAQALWGLAPKAIRKSPWLAALAALGLLASACRVDALVVLVASGLITMIARAAARRGANAHGSSAFFIGPAAKGTSVAKASLVGLGSLCLTFLKLGAVTFGSGYVLLAFLRADLVEQHHFLTEAQLIDAVAVGQITPGPVFTTATFIGYLLGGIPGAIVATIAIFTPGFALVAMLKPLLTFLRRTPLAGAFLDGVNVASVALMAFVTVQLGRSALIDWVTLLIAALSGVCLIRFKTSSTWLILAGAVIGVVLPR